MKHQSLIVPIPVLVLSGALLLGCSAAQDNSSNNAAKNSNVASAATVTTNAKSPEASNTIASAKPFSKTFELHGIKFVVESQNAATGNQVTITPTGLEVSSEPVMKSVEGEVYGAEIADLNVDQSPEIYVYARQSSGNKRASLIAFATNKKKSISEISMAADDPRSKDLAGFNGEDEFAIVESSFVRRFPLYDGTGPDAKKTGKTRQIQYKLKQGEAAWQLAVEKVVEF